MAPQVLFWAALLFIVYTYLLYPLLLFTLNLMVPKRRVREAVALRRSVSVVIAARDEEARIDARLRNLFEQTYADGDFEIILVVDGTEDNTAVVARKSIDSIDQKQVRVSIVELPIPQGKAHALNVGIAKAVGDIIVFTDCRQRFEIDAITELVNSFADPRVGCVSGELVFTESASSKIVAEMGAYWNYEKLIRKLESQTGSSVCATGAIYAIRRELFNPIADETILDDVVIPLNVSKAGFEIVFNSNARAFDFVSSGVSHEWRRKVRTLAGNWQLFGMCLSFFNSSNSRVFWRLFSHKFCRLFVPLWMFVCLVSALSAEGIFYTSMFWVQLAFYFAAFSVYLYPSLKRSKVLGLVSFFCVLNGAVVASFWFWITGRLDKLWPSSSHTVRPQ